MTQMDIFGLILLAGMLAATVLLTITTVCGVILRALKRTDKVTA
ncbi:MAG: hypothetical protein ACRCWD_00680 [Culicoidibacterales bacterium]